MRKQPRATDHRRELFEELFRLHYAEILIFARRRANAAVAHDVTAETFATAWRRWDELPKDRPLPWLYGVARRTLGNMRRSEQRQLAVARALEPTVGQEHGAGAADTERLEAALRFLSDSDRDTLLLVAWEGLSPEDAAAALGISYTSFRVRAHRARRRLRAALARDCDLSPVAKEPIGVSVQAKERRYG